MTNELPDEFLQLVHDERRARDPPSRVDRDEPERRAEAAEREARRREQLRELASLARTVASRAAAAGLPRTVVIVEPAVPPEPKHGASFKVIRAISKVLLKPPDYWREYEEAPRQAREDYARENAAPIAAGWVLATWHLGGGDNAMGGPEGFGQAAPAGPPSDDGTTFLLDDGRLGVAPTKGVLPLHLLSVGSPERLKVHDVHFLGELPSKMPVPSDAVRSQYVRELYREIEPLPSAEIRSRYRPGYQHRATRRRTSLSDILSDLAKFADEHHLDD